MVSVLLDLFVRPQSESLICLCPAIHRRQSVTLHTTHGELKVRTRQTDRDQSGQHRAHS